MIVHMFGSIFHLDNDITKRSLLEKPINEPSISVWTLSGNKKQDGWSCIGRGFSSIEQAEYWVLFSPLPKEMVIIDVPENMPMERSIMIILKELEDKLDEAIDRLLAPPDENTLVPDYDKKAVKAECAAYATAIGIVVGMSGEEVRKLAMKRRA